MTVLDATIPAGLDADGMTPDERRQFEALRATRAQQLLMQRIPLSTNIFDWTIRCGAIEAMIGGSLTDHETRARIMMLAEQFGFEYAETRHSPGKNWVCASGVYAEVKVKFWDLVAPCTCEDCGGAR